ncbi:MAG: 7-carboxy-7-deazaguanine synthase QueE [Luteolibacter sp.]|uniref:7-carboxy-7-deazaguanine synthase QueE n=1 Tax=Luteolibacter sp. TaxID=1962973 RepID=UPI0032666D23
MKLAKLGDGPEIFHTIQGEGVSVGAPAVFIRASRCNLHCVWCDTDHTWNFEGTPWPHEKDSVPGYVKHRKAAVTFEIDPVEAAERVMAFGCGRTVITGGEPLLQEKDFQEMIDFIRGREPGHLFEVETNGTRIPSPAFHDAVNQFNVSPKLSNAGMPESLRWNAEALGFFARSPKAWFKFVVAEPQDLSEIQQLRETHDIPVSRILLMPEGRTSAELDKSAAWLADICREHGYRFCDRLHIRIWGDKRGV